MDTKQPVQELKAERVQKELTVAQVEKELLLQDLVAEDPCRVSLKAERVQSPAIFANEGAGTFSSTFELTYSQSQRVQIELMALRTIVTLYGAANTTAGSGIESKGGQPKVA